MNVTPHPYPLATGFKKTRRT